MIQDVPEAANVGVIICSSLSMEVHVNKVDKLSYIQLRNIKKMRFYLTTEATKNSLWLPTSSFTLVKEVKPLLSIFYSATLNIEKVMDDNKF